MKKIILAVNNDLSYDQRMQKICTSLNNNGFDVTLIGIKTKRSLPLSRREYKQIRLPVFFTAGPLFFAEANIRMFFYFLFHYFDVYTANDLDTALPVLFASKIKNKKRVFDAHELFCEMHEIVRKPGLFKFWKSLEKFCQPKFKLGYTENQSYADEYEKMYGVKYFTVMNSPIKKDFTDKHKSEKFLLYQGVVDRGRGFEGLVPALKNINARLVVCGKGNYIAEIKRQAKELDIENKIELKGFVLPDELRNLTPTAYVGMNLNDNLGKSFYYSLSNRFFDYMHAAIPQVTMNYPENKKINEAYEIGILIDDLRAETIENAVNRLLNDEELYSRLQANCKKAREVYNWQNEEKKLVAFYSSL